MACALRFIGLRGTPGEIAAAAGPYGVVHEKHPGSTAMDYLVDHTATVMMIDGEGRIRLIWLCGTTGEDIAADLVKQTRYSTGAWIVNCRSYSGSPVGE